MDITAILQDYMVVPIVILCLLIGYVLKHWISDESFENRWIPVVVTIVGAIVGCIITLCSGDPITANSVITGIVSGGVSGASSSGLQSGFQAIIGGNKTEKEVTE